MVWSPSWRCFSLLLLCWAATGSAQGKGLKLAAQGLTASGLEPGVTTFLSDHLSQQLAHHGLEILTAAEVRALVGLERQRELLGCAEGQGCLQEVVNALGVDGVVAGAITRTPSGFEVKVELLSADGSRLAQGTRKVADEDALLPALSSLAEEVSALALFAVGQTAEKKGSDLKVEQRVKPRNVLSVSPLGLAFGYFGLEYERALGSHFSVVVAPQAIVGYATDIDAVEVTLGLRCFVFGKAPSELGLGPFVVIGTGTTRYLNGTVSGLSAAAGAEVLYSSYLLDDRLVLSAGAGWGLNFLPGYLSSPGQTLAGVPRLRFNVGWAF